VSRFGLLVRFPGLPGTGDALAAALLGADARLRTADGCEAHTVHRVAGEPDVVWVTEVFRDAGAHAAAMADPDVQAAAGRIAPLLAGPPERTETLPLS
jgi:quinol monooxygenase YgiN